MLAAMLAGKDPTLRLAPTRLTLGQAVDSWLHYVEHDRGRRASTLRDYGGTTAVHLRPRLGEDTPLDAITAADVNAMRVAMVAEGHSARNVNKVLTLAHGVFAHAVKAHGLASNPAVGVDRRPQRRSGDFAVLDPGEVALLAAHADRPDDAAFFIVAALTGLRLGEMLALRWAAVDFANAILHVRRSWVLGHEDTPMSHRVRSVPLLDQVARELDGMSRRPHFSDDGDRVFASEVGGVASGESIRRRFKLALAAAGLPPMRLHDLRHSFGTLAVQIFPLTDVKAFMGHSDVSTTMLYVHHVPQHDAADRLSRLVAAAQDVHPRVHRTERTDLELSATQVA